MNINTTLPQTVEIEVALPSFQEYVTRFKRIESLERLVRPACSRCGELMHVLAIDEGLAVYDCDCGNIEEHLPDERYADLTAEYAANEAFMRQLT